jgi:hypothetical protein
MTPSASSGAGAGSATGATAGFSGSAFTVISPAARIYKWASKSRSRGSRPGCCLPSTTGCMRIPRLLLWPSFTTFARRLLLPVETSNSEALGRPVRDLHVEMALKDLTGALDGTLRLSAPRSTLRPCSSVGFVCAGLAVLGNPNSPNARIFRLAAE